MPVARVPWEGLRSAAAFSQAAKELTHPIYRYPGSMSPLIARALITGLTKPGDLVLDPFCGGGTTAIEAIAHGRRVHCSDLNPLACFVTRAKAYPPTHESIRFLAEWVKREIAGFAAGERTRKTPTLLENNLRHAPKTYVTLVARRNRALRIPDPSARRIALLIVLRVGQLCFHCRSASPSPRLLHEFFGKVSGIALAGIAEYALQSRQAQRGTANEYLRVLNVDARALLNGTNTPSSGIKLILTSPPYPGVHVLYHRWQILGRRESSMPYDIIGTKDGKFTASHYTMGHRYEHDNETYFSRLTDVFGRLRRLLTHDATVAQVLS